MRDRMWSDTYGDWRRSWHLRVFAPYRLSRWWVNDQISWLWNTHLSKPVDVSTRNWLGGSCYCSTGNTTHLYVRAFGFGLMLWLHRDRGPQPCLCHLSLYEGLPDDYAEEIDELGGADVVKRLIGRWQRWSRRIGK
jgi:hypothetical protein